MQLDRVRRLAICAHQCSAGECICIPRAGASGPVNSQIPQIVEPSEDATVPEASAEEQQDAQSQQEQVDDRPESTLHPRRQSACPVHEEATDENETAPKVPVEQEEERGRLLARPFLLQVDTLPARNRNVQDATFALVFTCFIAFLVSLPLLALVFQVSPGE